MNNTPNRFTVFTKSWLDLPLPELARFVKELGFDGVELPVRPGYQVTPERVGAGLPEAARVLADHGLCIGSIAGPLDEATLAACGEAGVPIVRIMVPVDMKAGYRAAEEGARRQFDALLPLLERHRVTVGVQNHCNFFVGSAIGVMRLVEGYDPRRVGAVLDMAHCAVAGEPEAMAVDMAWSHLCLVNLKSGSRRRTNLPDAEEAAWEIVWTTARHSGFSWRELVRHLAARRYAGDLCLSAEYTDERAGGQLMGEAVVPLVRQDLAYARRLFAEETRPAGATS